VPTDVGHLHLARYASIDPDHGGWFPSMNLSRIETTRMLDSPSSGWSKEAVVALVTIFVMVLLSGISLAWKYCIMEQWRSDKRGIRWARKYKLYGM
jgi:hypothetical protein